MTAFSKYDCRYNFLPDLFEYFRVQEDEYLKVVDMTPLDLLPYQISKNKSAALVILEETKISLEKKLNASNKNNNELEGYWSDENLISSTSLWATYIPYENKSTPLPSLIQLPEVSWRWRPFSQSDDAVSAYPYAIFYTTNDNRHLLTESIWTNRIAAKHYQF